MCFNGDGKPNLMIFVKTDCRYYVGETIGACRTLESQVLDAWKEEGFIRVSAERAAQFALPEE